MYNFLTFFCTMSLTRSLFYFLLLKKLHEIFFVKDFRNVCIISCNLQLKLKKQISKNIRKNNK